MRYDPECFSVVTGYSAWMEGLVARALANGLWAASRLFLGKLHEGTGYLVCCWMDDKPGTHGREFLVLEPLMDSPDKLEWRSPFTGKMVPAKPPRYDYMLNVMRPFTEHLQEAARRERNRETEIRLAREEGSARRVDMAKTLRRIMKRPSSLPDHILTGRIPLANPRLVAAMGRKL